MNERVSSVSGIRITAPSSGPHKRADAAEHRGQRHQQRELKAHDAFGVDVGDELRVEAAADRDQERRDRRRAHLGIEHVDAEAFGGVRIVLYRAPPIAPFGIFQPPGDEPGDAGQRQREVEIRQLAARELELQPAIAAHRDIDAQRRPRPVPVVEQQQPDLGDDDGGDHEVMAAQPEAGIAEPHGDDAGDDTAAEHAEPRQHAELGEQQRGGIGADAEIEGVPQRDLSAITGEDVPALRQRAIHQGQHHDVLDVDVLDEQRDRGCDRGQTEGDDEIAAAAFGEIRIHHIDPNRPRGRMKTTSR